MSAWERVLDREEHGGRLKLGAVPAG
jgi:hypothetical protein